MFLKLEFPKEVIVEAGKDFTINVKTTEITDLEEVCKGKWIEWSTPRWKNAGLSDQDIAARIETEWNDPVAKADILRRCTNGEFD